MFDFWTALMAIVILIFAISAAMWSYYQRGRDSMKREEAENAAEIEKLRTIEANKPLANRTTILERMRQGKL